ncbi:MAG: ABC transporter permease [Candidatus Methanofastidiosia archaeon]
MAKELEFKIKDRREVERAEFSLRGSILSLLEGISKVLIMAYSLAMKNIRRRKVRSYLTFIGISVMVMAFVLSASITQGISVERYGKTQETDFYGLSITSRYTSELSRLNPAQERFDIHLLNIGIPIKVVEELKDNPKIQLVVPRIRTEFLSGAGRAITLQILGEKGSFAAYAVLGISPTLEDELRGSSNWVVEGRYFEEDDTNVVLLSEEQKGLRGFEIGDKLTLNLSKAGYEKMEVEIIGFFDTVALSQLKQASGSVLFPRTIYFRDLDPNPRNQELGIGPTEINTLIMPLKFAQEFLKERENVSDIDVVPLEGTTVEDLDLLANDIASKTELQVWVCDGEKSYVIWSLSEKHYAKLGPSFIVLLIAVLGILNMMLASVYERMGEIATMTSVGSSPGTVSQIFLAESSVYGFLGGLFGYSIAILIMLISNVLDLGLPPLEEKLTSYWFTMAVGGAFFTALISTYYPASQAGKLVVPSLMRRWRPSGLRTIITDIREGSQDSLRETLPVSLDINEFDAFCGFIWDKLYRPMFFYLYDAWKKDLSTPEKLVKIFGFTCKIVDQANQPIINIILKAEKATEKKRARVQIAMEFSDDVTISGSALTSASVKSKFLYDVLDQIRKIVLEYKVLRSKINPEDIIREILIKPEEMQLDQEKQ